MKFDLGETVYEKIERLEKWHRWFAWYPVKVKEHDYRWLETVERRRDYWDSYYYFEYYRALKKLTKENKHASTRRVS